MARGRFILLAKIQLKMKVTTPLGLRRKSKVSIFPILLLLHRRLHSFLHGLVTTFRIKMPSSALRRQHHLL